MIIIIISIIIIIIIIILCYKAIFLIVAFLLSNSGLLCVEVQCYEMVNQIDYITSF